MGATRLISIHAPARGASLTQFQKAKGFVPFQFTPLREGLHDCGIEMIENELFQFTPLREGLRGLKMDGLGLFIFQFTPLREGLRDRLGYTKF